MSLWSKLTLYVCTSARIGEHLEATRRAKSGRGLHRRVRDLVFRDNAPGWKIIDRRGRDQDMKVSVFRNERGEVEVAVQIVRDVKNMTWTPHKQCISTRLA